VASLLQTPLMITYQEASTERNAKIHTLLERSMLATILCSRAKMAKKILEYGQSRNFLMGMPKSSLKLYMVQELRNSDFISEDAVTLFKVIIGSSRLIVRYSESMQSRRVLSNTFLDEDLMESINAGKENLILDPDNKMEVTEATYTRVIEKSEYLTVAHLMEIMNELIKNDDMLVELLVRLQDETSKAAANNWLASHNKLELAQRVIDRLHKADKTEHRDEWILELINVALA